MQLLKLLPIAILCTACLDHSDTEAVGYSANVVDSNVPVRELERNQDAKMKLDLNDGLNSTTPLRTGYVAGHEVQYWDLGTAPTTAEPIWIFLRHLGESGEPIDPPLIDSIPGDTVYSPIRLIFEVYVTPKWAGQKFPSLRAVEDGIELGLLEDPVARESFTNCVVTLKDNVIEGPNGKKFMPTAAYYRGRIVYQFCIADLTGSTGRYPTKMGAPVFGNASLLRRENEPTTLDEALLKTDLNNDGDQLDANVIYDAAIGDAGYTSLWKNLDVVVHSDYELGSAKSQDDLFKKMSWGLQAIDPPVIEYKDTGTIVNRPLVPEAMQQ